MGAKIVYEDTLLNTRDLSNICWPPPSLMEDRRNKCLEISLRTHATSARTLSHIDLFYSADINNRYCSYFHAWFRPISGSMVRQKNKFLYYQGIKADEKKSYKENSWDYSQLLPEFILLTYNDFHNILSLFDILPNFTFPTSERMLDYYI